MTLLRVFKEGVTVSETGASASVSGGTVTAETGVSLFAACLLDAHGMSGSAADVTESKRNSLSVTTVLSCTTGSARAIKSCPIGDAAKSRTSSEQESLPEDNDECAELDFAAPLPFLPVPAVSNLRRISQKSVLSCMAGGFVSDDDDDASLVHEGWAFATVNGVKLAGKLFARNSSASSTCFQTNCDACGCILTKVLRSSPAFP